MGQQRHRKPQSHRRESRRLPRLSGRWNYASCFTRTAGVLWILFLLQMVNPVLNAQASSNWVAAWQVETTGEAWQGVRATNDRVYVAAGGDLVALNALDGSMVWTARTGTTYTLSPVTSGESLFTTNIDGTVTRWRAADGALEWQVTGALEYAGGPPLVTGDAVYVNGRVGSQGYLVAFDAATGAERWRVHTSLGGHLTPLALGGTIYTTAADPETGNTMVQAFDAATGSAIWHTPPSHELRLFGAGAAHVYAHTPTWELVALDPSGNEQWRFHPGEGLVWDAEGPSEVGGILYASAALGIAGAPSDDPAVFALDAATGTELWRAHTPGDVGPIGRPVVVGNTLVVVNQGSHVPLLLDRQSGEHLSAFPTVFDGYPLAFDQQAGLIVVGYDGRVVAYRSAS